MPGPQLGPDVHQAYHSSLFMGEDMKEGEFLKAHEKVYGEAGVDFIEGRRRGILTTSPFIPAA